jgi:hypothetical protein
VNPKPEVNTYGGKTGRRLEEENFVPLTTDLKGKTGVRPPNTTVPL